MYDFTRCMRRRLHGGEDRRGRRVARQCRKRRRKERAAAELGIDGDRDCVAGLHERRGKEWARRRRSGRLLQGDAYGLLHEPTDDCSDGSGLRRTARVKHMRRRGPRRLGLRQIGAETANCKGEAQPRLHFANGDRSERRQIGDRSKRRRFETDRRQIGAEMDT